MNPGVAKALGAMYKQLHRAFKVAKSLGAEWQVTNGFCRVVPSP